MPLKAAKKVSSIFAQDVYLGENSSQAASVEFVRQRRTNYARSRLQKNCRKAPWGIFDSLKGRCIAAALLGIYQISYHLISLASRSRGKEPLSV